jgi:hypothetical protein
MRCQEVEELLSAYLEGELPAGTDTDIERHLQECSACYQTKENLDLLLSKLPDLQVEVPFFLKNRLYNIAEVPVPVPAVWSFGWLPRWVVTAAAAVVLLCGLFYFSNFYPAANRQMHALVTGVDRVIARTGGWMEKIQESKDLLFYTLFSSGSSSTGTTGMEHLTTEKLPPKGGANG